MPSRGRAQSTADRSDRSPSACRRHRRPRQVARPWIPRRLSPSNRTPRRAHPDRTRAARAAAAAALAEQPEA
eukprot:5863083-Prymnesium_polylepis.1